MFREYYAFVMLSQYSPHIRLIKTRNMRERTFGVRKVHFRLTILRDAVTIFPDRVTAQKARYGGGGNPLYYRM